MADKIVMPQSPSPGKKPRPVAVSTKGNLRKTLLALAIPFVVLLICEAFLRLVGVGDDIELFRHVNQHGKEWLQVNQQVSRRYFVAQPEFAREVEEALIYPHRQPDMLRIVCLGGSSMAGFPYSFNATMPGILYTRLKELFPTKEIEVLNLGIPAVSSFAVRNLMADITELEPDAVLIYTGHNEFYGALGVGSGFRFGQHRSLINLTLDLQPLSLFYGLQKLLLQFGNTTVESDSSVMRRMAAHRNIPYNDPLVEQAAENLYQNLGEAVQMAQAQQIPVFIGSLASNLADHPPFVSKAAPSLASTAFQSSADSGFGARALLAIDKKLQQDSTIADLWYQKGRWLQMLGRAEEAKRAFLSAREHDLLRFRAPKVFNRRIRQVCEESGATLVDVENAMAMASPDGIIGREMMAEHLHPTISGYQVMAESFLTALVSAKTKILPDKNIEQASSDWHRLYITDLDAEMGAQQISKLTADWPFRKQINIPVAADSQLRPIMISIARRHLSGQLKWGGAHLEYAKTITNSPFVAEAVSEYLTVLNFYPDKYMGRAAADVYLALADVYGRNNNVVEAEKTLRIALHTDKMNRSVNAALGRLLVHQKRFNEAEPILKVACQVPVTFNDEEFAQLLFLWGGCLANARRIDEAKKVFRQVLQVNPQHRQAEAFLRSLP